MELDFRRPEVRAQDRATLDTAAAGVVARTRPQSFQRRAIAWAVLGYGFGSAVTLAAVALATATLMTTVARPADAAPEPFWPMLLAVVMLFVVLRGMFSPRRSTTADLYRVPPDAGTELHAQVDAVAATLGAKVDAVWLSPSHDVQVRVTSASGVFGPDKRTLTLGIMALADQTRGSMRAVIARTLAADVSSAGSVPRWVRAAHNRWAQWTSRDDLHWTSHVVFAPFYRWLSRRLAPYCRVATRDVTMASALKAGELTTPSLTVESLVRDTLGRQRAAHAIWPSLLRGAPDDAPPANIYRRATAAAAAGFTSGPNDETMWLARAWAHAPSPSSAMVALADVVEALEPGRSVPPPVPAPSGVDSALNLLAEARDDAVGFFSSAWSAQHRSTWGFDSRARREAAERLSELERVVAAGRLGEDEQREFAEQLIAAGRLDEGIAALEEWLERATDAPDRAAALIRLADACAGAGHASALRYADAAVSEEGRMAAAAERARATYYTCVGDHERAATHRARHQEKRAQSEIAQAQRSSVSERDELTQHAATAAQLARLTRFLERTDGVSDAWLVRKVLDDPAAPPVHVLAVASDFDGKRIFLGRANRALHGELSTAPLPPSTLVIVLGPSTFWLRHHCDALPEAHILTRNKASSNR